MFFATGNPMCISSYLLSLCIYYIIIFGECQDLFFVNCCETKDKRRTKKKQTFHFISFLLC